MAMLRNIGVSKVVALVVALAKLHNFCIGESNVIKRLPPRMYHRDRYHIMNADGGYVCLSNDDPQQNTLVPTGLMHAGEHFDDVPYNVRRSRSEGRSELPRTVLFEMIADGHWERPTRLGTNTRGR
jgi:hypothetical protein